MQARNTLGARRRVAAWRENATSSASSPRSQTRRPTWHAPAIAGTRPIGPADPRIASPAPSRAASPVAFPYRLYLWSPIATWLVALAVALALWIAADRWAARGSAAPGSTARSSTRRPIDSPPPDRGTHCRPAQHAASPRRPSRSRPPRLRPAAGLRPRRRTSTSRCGRPGPGAAGPGRRPARRAVLTTFLPPEGHATAPR